MKSSQNGNINSMYYINAVTSINIQADRSLLYTAHPPRTGCNISTQAQSRVCAIQKYIISSPRSIPNAGNNFNAGIQRNISSNIAVSMYQLNAGIQHIFCSNIDSNVIAPRWSHLQRFHAAWNMDTVLPKSLQNINYIKFVAEYKLYHDTKFVVSQ